MMPHDAYLFAAGAFLLATLAAGIGIWLGRRLFSADLRRQLQAERERCCRLEQLLLEADDLRQQALAQDLHDGLSGVLSAAVLRAAVLRDTLTAQGHGRAATCRQLAGLLDQAAQETRALALGRLPVRVEGGHLDDALTRVLDGLQAAYGFSYSFDYDPAFSACNDRTATHLYRIAQEALVNAVRHGEATHISLRLGQENGQAVFTVTDNGTGLACEAAARPANGLGMQTMQVRARMIGGGLTVGSTDRGTTVTCRFPWPLAEPRTPTPLAAALPGNETLAA